MNTTKLINEVGFLPIEERARLVDSLLQALNPVDETAAAWLATARRRLDELDSRRGCSPRVDAVRWIG